mgnify:CR=1 FL=1
MNKQYYEVFSKKEKKQYGFTEIFSIYVTIVLCSIAPIVLLSDIYLFGFEQAMAENRAAVIVLAVQTFILVIKYFFKKIKGLF